MSPDRRLSSAGSEASQNWEIIGSGTVTTFAGTPDSSDSAWCGGCFGDNFDGPTGVAGARKPRNATAHRHLGLVDVPRVQPASTLATRFRWRQICAFFLDQF